MKLSRAIDREIQWSKSVIVLHKKRIEKLKAAKKLERRNETKTIPANGG